MSTIFPRSIGIDDLIVPEYILKKKEILVKRIGEENFDFDAEIKLLVDELFLYLEKNNSGLADLINSGAKGDRTLYGVLVLAKGSSIDIEGNITSGISESQNTGYSLVNFFANANEARYTQYAKSLGSKDPGVIARSVAYACNSVVLTGTVDCGTTKFVNYPIDKDNVSSIYGRYFQNIKGKLEVVTQDNAKSLVGQIVKLRSPIYCIDKSGICDICYGLLKDKNNTRQIGMISSTVTNEIGVNMAMKLRHSSSHANRPKSNFVKDLKELN